MCGQEYSEKFGYVQALKIISDGLILHPSAYLRGEQEEVKSRFVVDESIAF
jgi:hypothetical protein